MGASLAGGVGLQTLLLISLIPVPENLPSFSLSVLLILGAIVTCLATGLLAAISAEDDIKNSLERAGLPASGPAFFVVLGQCIWPQTAFSWLILARAL
jgi:hypothetical protein